MRMAATTSPKSEADLRSFLEGAGRSLTEAQGTLTASTDLQTTLVISSAELEAKVALKTNAQGQLSVEPLSSQDLLAKINAGAISTVRVSYVTTAPETAPGKPRAPGPVRKPDDVVADVKARPDVAALDSILGGLKFETVFVAESKRWLVTATDPKGRVVRETILLDELKEANSG